MATTFNDATQGMNVEQRRAYRNSMTPPPATPVTPQPAPVPTVPPVTGQGAVVPPATPIATPSAPVATAPSQTMTPAPTTPPIIQANQPMVPTTPEAPQPAPVAPPKAPKTPKVQASTTPAIDYNQGLGREAEIMTHLKEFQAQGMNPDQIKLASGYATATPEKKAMIDGVIAGQNKPMDESSMYATIASGAVIPDAVKSTQAYQNAQNLYTKVSGYSTMSTSSLAHSMSTGDLLP